MLKKRNLFVGLAVFMGLVFSFLAGRGVAQQQPLPVEQPASFAFPAAWGDLHSVTPTSIGFAYVFVSRADGTIRVAQGTAIGIAQIQTIPRR
jgi:hypothetical protein